MTFLPGLTDIGTDGRVVMKDVLSKNVEKISKNKKNLSYCYSQEQKNQTVTRWSVVSIQKILRKSNIPFTQTS